MALLTSQLTIIQQLIDDETITESQGIDLLMAQNGFSAAQKTFIRLLPLSDADMATLLAENRLTQEQLETEINEVKLSIVAGDYDTAKRQLVIAELTLASMPDYELGNRKIMYRDQLARVRKSIDEIKTINAGSSINRRVVARHIRE